MLNLKSVIGASLFAVSAMAASSAFAYTPTGNSTAGPGPTTLSFAGTNVPCTGTFTITVAAGGTATVTGASFGTNAACTSIVPKNLPWTIGAASGGPTTYSAAVTGASVFVGSLGVTCTQAAGDAVTITLNNSTGQATFNGTLHSGTIPCGVSGTGLTTAVRAP